MASKVLSVLLLVLISFKSVLLQAVTKNDLLPEDQIQQDAEVQRILFGSNPQIQDCIETDITFNQRSNTDENESVFTVVILQEEMFRGRKLNIQQCTGSLIHPQVVLTAAHCVYQKSLENLKIRAGECKRIINAKSPYYQERKIESFQVLSDYDPTMPHNDIALLYLQSPFSITNNVKTVCLPPAGVELNLDYVRCFASGWERKPKILPGYENFRKVNMTVIPSDNCESALQLTGLGDTFALDRNFMCAAGINIHKDVLVANGGAPLVCSICGSSRQTIQVGVMSWGFGNNPLPEVFTSIKNSNAWIRERLNERDFKVTGCGTRMTVMGRGLPLLRN